MGNFYILITIDTESPQSFLKAGLYKESGIISLTNKNNYGITKIINILKRYNINATFYLNIYEKYYVNNGDYVFKNICELICNSGNDVQLHTHPVWLYDIKDKRKINMNQYTYLKQVEIINKGLNEIELLTSKRPIAHRAGAYGINNDTIKALKENGIKIDSSMFYKHENCKVRTWSYNKVAYKNDLFEIPVSVYYKIKVGKVYDFSKIIHKVDVNWSSPSEIISFYRKLKSKNIYYMNLFMHSYSFCNLFSGNKFNKDFLLTPNKEIILNFCKVLDFLKKEEQVEFITTSKFYDVLQKDFFSSETSDYLPVLI